MSETYGTDTAATGSLNLQPTQIEAHVTRLRAIRTGLEKFREHDYRAAGAIIEVDAAIDILSGEAPPVGQFAPTEPELEPESHPSGWNPPVGPAEAEEELTRQPSGWNGAED